jgi:hypothetical protein
MAQASPSTLGFNSPQPDFTGLQSPAPAPAASNDFAGQYGGQQQQGQYSGGNQFASSQTSGQYGGGDQFAAPAQNSNQYGGGDPFSAPQPSGQQQQYGVGDQFAAAPQNPSQYGGGDFGFAAAPAPAYDQGYASQPNQQQQQPPPSESPAPQNTGPTLTMNSLQGHDEGGLANGNDASANAKSGSLADQLYSKFASMDQFDLVSKKDTSRSNPFESAPVGAQQSLAEMKKQAKVSFSSRNRESLSIFLFLTFFNPKTALAIKANYELTAATTGCLGCF